MIPIHSPRGSRGGLSGSRGSRGMLSGSQGVRRGLSGSQHGREVGGEYIFFLRNYNKENKQVGLSTLLWGSLLLHTASPIDAQTFGMFPR